MENLERIGIIIIRPGIKLDEMYLEIEERADRKEMCAYRNAIIEEKLRRQNEDRDLVKEVSKRTKRKTLSSVPADIIMAVVGGVLAWRAFGRGETALGVAFLILIGILIVVMLGSIAANKYGISFAEAVATAEEAERLSDDDEFNSAIYAQVGKDSSEKLDIKKARLDSLLGF